MIRVCCFMYGAIALICLGIWAKSLWLRFVGAVLAVAGVLAVLMGGLALGKWLVGRRADWLQHPLAAYGYIEAVIGLYAFFFDWFYSAADGVFVKLGSLLIHQSAALLALKTALSIVLLLGPTVLMGGTLPLLAAWL